MLWLFNEKVNVVCEVGVPFCIPTPYYTSSILTHLSSCITLHGNSVVLRSLAG